MPSGAKRRKAAKKKKEKENTINPQGNDALMSQDENGSDGGEGSSPAHHDRDGHHHPFNEGSAVVEEGDPSAVQPPASDAKYMEEVPSDIHIEVVTGGNEASVVMIERVLESEESSEAQNVSFQHTETAMESYHGNGHAGGTSHGESLAETNSEDQNHSSNEVEVTCHELVDSSSSKMTLIPENEPIEEGDSSAVESPVNPVKVVACVSDVENSDIVCVLQENSGAPHQGVTDLAVKINGDKVSSPLTDEKGRTSSLEEPKPKEYDSEVLTSLSATPSMKLSSGAEHIENSETPACSKNQPLAASAQPMVQKTSLLSCCGLFEVLLGQNR